jgi:hypothetical protein
MASERQAERAFIESHSIVRKIWSHPDLLLLIFAGSAAEFALNRAVDWLFFTNALPRDPIGRLFSTIRYAQRIVFAGEAQARTAIASIAAIHAGVERARGQRIPDWAFRDVLYMLIDYSQRAHELLLRPLGAAEREDLCMGLLKIGHELHIPQLPETYRDWIVHREQHLERDLAVSDFTERLFLAYRAQLGLWRYQVLLEIQALLVPARVSNLLGFQPKHLVVGSCVQMYALTRHLGLQTLVQRLLIPQAYWWELEQLSPRSCLGWNARDGRVVASTKPRE